MPAQSGNEASAEAGLRLYTPAQAAELLQVPESWLRKKAAAGTVQHTRIGRHMRFSHADLRLLIRLGHRPAQQ
ncbi:helix-turn-helix domain-containing protein [Streptomyces yerevanensis]|uniref:helix-turn-helix domain-containing protein n=1 Tax=Streptomyces yerevanensis TaxID=66378 RepID=UPI001B80016E